MRSTQNRFNQKCKKVNKSMNIAARDAFICFLEYSALFASKSKPVYEAVETEADTGHEIGLYRTIQGK